MENLISTMKSMLLINGSWDKKTTFKMIPATIDCPYAEAIYDMDTKVLVLIGKEKKQTMHMVAKLDDNGDVKMMKIGRRDNGKDYAEERRTLDTYYEYFVENPEDIKNVINEFAINADTFDFSQFLNAPAPTGSNLLTM